jgi:acetyltransferase-like isoleucine patch superfamily enzyme
MSRRGITIYKKCKISSSARIFSGAIIGKPFRPLINTPPEASYEVTIIKDRAYIGHHCIVGAGSIIESDAVLDDFSVIECGVHIGKNSLSIYRAQFCNDVRIGEECVIGGFIGERVVVGDRCRIFGAVVHSQHRPDIPWDSPDVEEGSAHLGDGVFIGFNATVIGAITIGRMAYICSGAIVTKNVPAHHVVSGINKITHCEHWKGRLSKSLAITFRHRSAHSKRRNHN